MNIVVGGALAPVPMTAPKPSLPKVDPGLRLPSFEALGIAAPHPDRFGQQNLDGAFQDTALRVNMKEPLGHSPEDGDLVNAFATLGGGSSSNVNAAADLAVPKVGGRATNTPVHHYVATLTPPAEGGQMNWNTMPTVSSAPMDSPATDPGAAASNHEASGASPVLPEAGSAGTVVGSAPRTVPVMDSAIIDDAEDWVENAVHALSRSSYFPSACAKV